MPKRIQRKRTKGWRMPENTVYVGRPTQWGNPFKDAPYIAVKKYQGWLVNPPINADGSGWINELHILLEPLRGKDLACWCPLGESCHADVLLELANTPTQLASSNL